MTALVDLEDPEANAMGVGDNDLGLIGGEADAVGLGDDGVLGNDGFGSVGGDV